MLTTYRSVILSLIPKNALFYFGIGVENSILKKEQLSGNIQGKADVISHLLLAGV